MFESLKELKGFALQATDGEIGKVEDFYFDSDEWSVRYLVVDTGGWLSGRRVLISPDVLSVEPDRERKVFPVGLTRQQVKDSPDIDTKKPVSRQQEETLRMYYGWPAYWSAGMGTLPPAGVPMPAMPVPVTGSSSGNEQDEERQRRARQNPNLHSFNEVAGYSISAENGHVGRVSDFIVEDEKWNILYMIVDTGNLFPGRKVLVSPSWIQAVSWEEKQIDVDLKVETIRDSPEYDPKQPIDQQFEEGLYRHYGKPYRR